MADNHIHMRDFRKIIHGVVAGTENLARKMLFGWWPDAREISSLKDNLAVHRPDLTLSGQLRQQSLTCISNNLSTCILENRRVLA